MTPSELERLANIAMKDMSVTNPARKAICDLVEYIEKSLGANRPSEIARRATTASRRNRLQLLLEEYHDKDCLVMTTYYSSFCTCGKMGNEKVDEHF